MSEMSNRQPRFEENIIKLPLYLRQFILGFLEDIDTSKWDRGGFVKDLGETVYWTNKPMKVYHQLICKLGLNFKVLVNCLGNYIGYVELKSIRNLAPPIYHFFIIKEYYADHTCCECMNKGQSYINYKCKKDEKCDHCLRESSSVKCCPRSKVLYIGQKIEDAVYQLLVENCGKSTCSCASKYSNILIREILLEDVKEKPFYVKR